MANIISWDFHKLIILSLNSKLIALLCGIYGMFHSVKVVLFFISSTPFADSMVEIDCLLIIINCGTYYFISKVLLPIFAAD